MTVLTASGHSRRFARDRPKSGIPLRSRSWPEALDWQVRAGNGRRQSSQRMNSAPGGQGPESRLGSQSQRTAPDAAWACITRTRRQSMGRSRGGLTSKIHVLPRQPPRRKVRSDAARRPRRRCRLDQRDRCRERRLPTFHHAPIATIRSGDSARILYRARNLVERFFNKDQALPPACNAP